MPYIFKHFRNAIKLDRQLQDRINRELSKLSPEQRRRTDNVVLLAARNITVEPKFTFAVEDVHLTPERWRSRRVWVPKERELLGPRIGYYLANRD